MLRSYWEPKSHLGSDASLSLSALPEPAPPCRAKSCLTLCDPMNCSTPGLPVHHQLGVHPDSRPSSQWCHPAISSSVVPFSSCPQSLPASGSFPMSQLFTWGAQSIGISASASVPPMNTQDWFPLEWTGWISFQSKGLSRVFSNTTVQKHQFFCAQLSLQGKAFLGLSRSEEGKKTVLIMELVVLCNGLLSSKRWLPKEIRTVWGN